jgi:hypothetical protein
VVPIETAQRKAKLDFDVQYKYNQTTGGIESYNTQEIGAVYALTANCPMYERNHLTIPGWSKMYGSLIDLRTNQLIKSFKTDIRFSGRHPSDLLDELLDDLMQ